MSKSVLLIGLVLSWMASYGQNISVTFTGTGATTQIDSVTATNLTTNQSITFPGNETLVLTLNTGIPSVSKLTDSGIVYPNPFSGKSTFRMVFQQPQTVNLRVQNLVGQVIAQAKAFVHPGENEFALSLETAGIYMVTLTTEEARSSYKIICSGATTAGNSIQCLGAVSNNLNPQNNQNSTSASALKSLNSGYTLGYTSGDIIHYLCRSSIYSSVLTDSPASSKNYEVFFAACTDPDGKNYSIVKIGTQTWMIDNLAYLPSVSPSSSGSDTSPYYYVYGYEGNSVSAAKGTKNYATYGVLYNWEAAKTACPSDWHLPTDEEWKILEKNQGMSESDANSGGWRYSGRVGGKIKESGYKRWNNPNSGATNASGFAALPGGSCYYPSSGGGFGNLRWAANFWSASEYNAAWAWYRVLDYNEVGVNRSITNKYIGFSVRCLKN